MNSIRTHTIYCDRASRTLEITLITNGFKKKFLYIYNYEGYSFRVFDSKKHFMDFYNSDIETETHFDDSDQLDNYLVNLIHLKSF
jgi:hypothetical protein